MLHDFLLRKTNSAALNGEIVPDDPLTPTLEPAQPEAPAKPQAREPVLALAMGGGAARGWAHIGVLRAFDRAGLKPGVIAGTSIGAVVGGCYAAGKLDALEDFARSLTRRRVFGLMDFRLRSALIGGDRLRDLLDEQIRGGLIEDLPIRFATVATELGSGHEVWLSKGPLVPAMRASYAMPGVFEPVKLGGRWLFDGALVNPVPVTGARALGADIVIAINLNGDLLGRGTIIPGHDASEDLADTARGRFGWRSPSVGDTDRPGLATVMIETFNITQDRITRSRLAGDPPDVHIKPALGRIGIFEFHRAAEAIAHGEEAGEAALTEIRAILATLPRRG
jgi:NTE family protein